MSDLTKQAYICQTTGQTYTGQQLYRVYLDLLEHPDVMDLGFSQFIDDGYTAI